MKVWFLLLLIVVLCGCVIDDSIVTEAVEKQDPELCMKIELDDARMRCIIRVAAAAKDTEICKKYFTKDKEEMEGCLLSVAGASGDLNTCNEITDTRSRMDCYDNVGRLNKDPSVCAMIDDEYKGHKDRCFFNIAKDLKRAELCEQTTLSQIQCYTYLAEETSKPELCEKIDLDYPRDNCYLDAAKNTDQKDACDGISDDTKRKQCKSRLLGDPKECGGLLDQHLDHCILLASEKAAIITDCERIENQYKKIDCITNSAKNAKDHTLCEKLDEYSINPCIYAIAIENSQSIACKAFKEQYNIDTCLLTVAQKTLSLKDCDDISDKEMRRECREEVTEKRREQDTGEESTDDKILKLLQNLNEEQMKEFEKDIKSFENDELTHEEKQKLHKRLQEQAGKPSALDRLKNNIFSIAKTF